MTAPRRRLRPHRRPRRDDHDPQDRPVRHGARRLPRASLFSFTRDKGTSSRCYGACAAAWPVTYAKGSPVARGGARQSLVGRQRRKDGRFQATYAGKALYYYVDDRPGVALCHNVREFGGLWLLERANGRSV